MEQGIVNYTALVGNIDKKREDILCFGANERFISQVMEAKIYKILSHKFVDSDISIWTDSNVILKDKEYFVKEYLKENDIVVFRHPYRECIYEESKAGVWKNVPEQVSEYRAEGYPENNGLYECGFIIRKNNRIVEDFNNAWWAEICRWSSRDQISFPYVLRKFPELKLGIIEGNMRSFNKITWKEHYA